MTAPAFTISCDDLDWLSLWCSACPHVNLMAGEPAQGCDTEIALEHINDLAARHLRAAHRMTDPGAPARTEPELVTLIKRLAALEGAAFLTEAQGRERNIIGTELRERWPGVYSALVTAYAVWASW